LLLLLLLLLKLCPHIPTNQNLTKDGVCVRFDTLPVGGAENNDRGYALVHEVDHWLGIYHVFQSLDEESLMQDNRIEINCDVGNENDYVDDTPVMAYPTHAFHYACINFYTLEGTFILDTCLTRSLTT
jgi:hypothetical protein